VIKVAIGIAVGILTGLIGFIRDGLGPVFTWLYENIIKPVFDAIAAAITWVWETILKPTFDAWVWLFQNVIGPAFNWLWETIIKPVFDGIGAAMKWLWETILKPTFDAWVWIFQNILGPAFSWLYENVIKPVFDGIGAAIKWVWENVIKPVFDTLTKVIQEDIPKGFEQGKKFIEDIWKGIQDVVKAPIKFVVQTVLNDGLIKAFNTVADFLNIGKLPNIALPEGFAAGGWTGPGSRDQPAGIVHADEHVIRKWARRRMEREVPGLLDHINHYGTLFGYAGGGRVAPLKELLVTQGYNRVHKGIDYAAAVGTPVFATQDGVVTHAGPGARGPGVWGGEEVHILGNGIETWFAHLSRIGVKLGDMVRAGQMIAQSGNTGISSGPHLHFGVFSGGWPNDIDPAAYLGGAGAPSGGGFNPITAIIDALVTKFKEAFPGGGAFIDLVGGVGKSILIGAADFITGLFSDSQDKKGNAVGVDPALYDLGGVLPPGVSQVVNRTSKPEAILNAQQWADIHRLAAREASRDRPGVSIGTVHVRDENEMVRLIRNSERDAQAVYGF
jgi:murein DD-endopeptidase MepM/ murein hydrolase activator NlpD